MDWRGYPALELELSCCGDSHVVCWEAGALTVPAHDHEGEDVLTALGADPVACRTLAAAWGDVEDPRRVDLAFYLLIDARKLEPVPRSPIELPRRPNFSGPGSGVPATRHEVVTSFHHRAIVCSLPREWLLVAAAPRVADANSWQRLPGDDTGSICMTIAGLAARELDRCWPAERPQPRVQCDPWSVAVATENLVVLPPWWLSSVLARGGATIGGSFVLDLVLHPERDETFVARVLVTSGRSLSERSVLVRRTAHGWR